jgi:hypothetical protein
VRLDLQYRVPTYKYAGLLRAPVGLLFHSTRSGQPYNTDQEYRSTCSWAMNNVQTNPITKERWHLGWHATIGDLCYAPHIPLTHYGWNAGSESSIRVAYEFAQANIDLPISDEQLIAAVHHTIHVIKPSYPALFYQLLSHAPSLIVEHWQIPQGQQQGKSDVDPRHPNSLENRYWTLLKKYG